MLRIATTPYLMKIVAKIDLRPVIEKLKDNDLFDNDKPVSEQLDKEKLGIIGMDILSEITPQLGKIADDIVPLVAAYKNVSVEDAENLDALEMISEIINDEGIVSFFKSALQKKGAHGA
jgi:hypothetical protein